MSRCEDCHERDCICEQFTAEWVRCEILKLGKYVENLQERVLQLEAERDAEQTWRREQSERGA